MPKATPLALAILLCLPNGPAAAEDWNDPTRPDNYRASGPRGGAPVYVVSAIFSSDNRQVAVVNGRLVREGDRIGQVEVVRIDEDRVTLSANQKTRVVALNNRRNGR
ncbi:MAG: general secretion pathway protein GspB [Pseudomonadota bacterium]